MNRQSTIIFAVLIFAFIIYVTMKGDLPKWFALFKMQGQHAAPATGTGGGSSGGGGFSAGDAAKLAGQVVGDAILPGLGTIGTKVGSFISKLF